MNQLEALQGLHTLVVEIFDQRPDADRLARQSGIEISEIQEADDLDGYWWNVLVVCHHQQRVCFFVDLFLHGLDDC